MKKVCKSLCLCVLAVCLAASENFASAQKYGVQEIRGIVYASVDGVDVKLNLFLPVDPATSQPLAKADKPLLIFLNSGCWYSGNPGNGGLWRAFGCVERGCVVASVAHRSLDKYAFPCQIEDVKSAVRFLRANAEKYGFDKNRVAVLGLSSGGHLATMLGLPDDVRLFDVGENLQESSRVQFVINFFSTADMPSLAGKFDGVDCIYLALGAQREEGRKLSAQASSPELLAAARKYSPITYVSAGSSPTLHLYGVQDPIVPVSQGCLFHEALKRAGVRTQLYINNTGVHSWQSLGSLEELRDLIFNFIQWEELK